MLLNLSSLCRKHGSAGSVSLPVLGQLTNQDSSKRGVFFISILVSEVSPPRSDRGLLSSAWIRIDATGTIIFPTCWKTQNKNARVLGGVCEEVLYKANISTVRSGRFHRQRDIAERVVIRQYSGPQNQGHLKIVLLMLHADCCGTEEKTKAKCVLSKRGGGAHHALA